MINNNKERKRFALVSHKVDFIALEHEQMNWWKNQGVVEKYLIRNSGSDKRMSFIDGPITANNPMGVHHAWGRTYKDVFLRWRTMQGYKQRYQNGFDGQGLWVEVEVEKEKGFKSKRDIENYGIDHFVNDCKSRVKKYAQIQTEQSKRLGYWMDWANSYHTMSDENNYTIWHFLKRCEENGWLYQGTDSMPWCARCGTGLSQHEIVTEGYKDVTHTAVYVRFPLISSKEHEHESLLIWTTTPWTLSSNVAAAVHPKHRYVRARKGEEIIILGKERLSVLSGKYEIIDEFPGQELIGMTYRGPFDEFPAQREVDHRVIPWEEVGEEEGTAIVHIAPGAGPEDFALGKEHGLDVIAPLDESGIFIEGFGWLTGKSVFDVRDLVFTELTNRNILYKTEEHAHRYPYCWRCDSELVFRVVDEWFISMDELRYTMMDATKNVQWIPSFGRERELDWLRNMHDWMISKKRYWGLALPIWKCHSCGKFEVMGSETELKSRAVKGWEEFEGQSPHRPWIDAVKIDCSNCDETISRVRDVGNPWLDAGIVPFSTLNYKSDPEYWKEWFPADWISESFPGQFRNWFYSLLAMSATLEKVEPFKACFSYALVRDESGAEMHKSKGNAIWFDEAAEKMGVDVMRWMYLRNNPANNLKFGYGQGDEVRRQVFIPVWNVYSFFVNYANIDGWTPTNLQGTLTELDCWAISELNRVIKNVTDALETWHPEIAIQQIEKFIDDLSNWYVRRSRRRFWRSNESADSGIDNQVLDTDKQAAYGTLYQCLVTLTKLMAPFSPFIAEAIYRNLVVQVENAPDSVHLCDWPVYQQNLINENLSNMVSLAMRLSRLGRSARAVANLRVRQPLSELVVSLLNKNEEQYLSAITSQLKDELNVKEVRLSSETGGLMTYAVKPNFKTLGPRFGSKMRQVAQIVADSDPLEVVESINSGQSFEIKGFTFNSDDLIVETVPREEYSIAEEAGYQVGVLKELTEELKAEGIVREVVHMINNLRRESGLDITDRIILYIDTDDRVEVALKDHEGLLMTEILATSIIYDSFPPKAMSGKHILAETTVSLGIIKAG